ncbi:MAG: hypothetical protein AAGJ08_16210 [Cyanobacteria bacterium P01_H01_bin.35]
MAKIADGLSGPKLGSGVQGFAPSCRALPNFRKRANFCNCLKGWH